MKISNPFSHLYAKAESPIAPLVTITVTNPKDKRDTQTYQKVEVYFRRQIIPVIFDAQNKRYQILPGLDRSIRRVYGEGQEIKLAPEELTLSKWKKLTADFPADEAGIKGLACSIITREKNFRVVRLFRWSAHSISNLTSKAYNHPHAGKTAKWALATLLMGIGVYYWKQASCALNTPVQSPMKIDNSFFTRLLISLRMNFSNLFKR